MVPSASSMTVRCPCPAAYDFQVTAALSCADAGWRVRIVAHVPTPTIATTAAAASHERTCELRAGKARDAAARRERNDVADDRHHPSRLVRCHHPIAKLFVRRLRSLQAFNRTPSDERDRREAHRLAG